MRSGGLSIHEMSFTSLLNRRI
uniref:Uncharacterized protein n=1 Tax=Arundo donax TaxID=35708 RepID=A0A0A8ZRB2_ARUDO